MTDPLKTSAILIVDDESAILDELKAVLELEGYSSVQTANSGAAGLHWLEQHPAELVISDQKMPEMTGTEFLSQVKEKYPHTVTLVLSAFSETQDLMEAINRAGIHQYLLKPWNRADLLHQVGRALCFYHAEKEQRRLAQANRRLIKQLALMDRFSLVGDFSLALYHQFFPAVTERIKRCSVHDPDRESWGHLGLVISRLGKLATFYHGKYATSLNQNGLHVLRNCVIEAKRKAQELNPPIQWIENYEPDLPDLKVSESIFSLGVRALIENAVIFSKNTKEDARKVTLSVRQSQNPERMLVIEIGDHGEGVRTPQKLFEPLYSTQDQSQHGFYFQHELNEYNFTPYHHVGLGLTIAQWAFSQSNGTVEYIPSEQPGALFRVEIPLA